MAGVRAGDSAAFKALYDRYAASMVRFAAASLRSTEQAEDVVQEIFLNVWRNRATWEPTGPLRSYLMRATYNRIVMHHRHLRVELTAHESIVRDAGSPAEWTHRGATDDALAADELAAALARAVDALPPRTAQAYRLVREQHLSYAEAAEVMGITTHTVEIHMIRALKALREQLRDWRR